MLDALRPMGLSAAARALGVDPFEVVRLMVASGADMEHLQLSAAGIDAVRDMAGIESWWTEARLPDDPDPRRAAVRGAFAQLVTRGYVGSSTTRMDNLWRGLGLAQQVAIEQAVYVLVEDGAVATAASPKGVQIAAVAGEESHLADLSQHPGLAPIWEG